jgi:hypothetical protein
MALKSSARPWISSPVRTSSRWSSWPAAMSAVAWRRRAMGAAMRRAKAAEASMPIITATATSSSVRCSVAATGASACARGCWTNTSQPVDRQRDGGCQRRLSIQARCIQRLQKRRPAGKGPPGGLHGAMRSHVQAPQGLRGIGVSDQLIGAVHHVDGAIVFNAQARRHVTQEPQVQRCGHTRCGRRARRQPETGQRGARLVEERRVDRWGGLAG